MLAAMDVQWYPVLGLACLVAFGLAVAFVYWLVSVGAPSTDTR